MLEYGIKLLLTELLRCDAHQTGTPERLQLVMQYLQANYAKPITLSQLAALEHVSVSYLSRQFRRYTGKTVITYLNELRVQAAQALLIQTDEPVETIAEQAGFESPKYFSRIFRAKMGISPKSYRAQMRKI